MEKNKELILPDKFVELDKNEMMYLDGGRVSIRINFSPRIRYMTGFRAGLTTKKVVAGKVAPLKLKGPLGIAAAFTITSSVAMLVGNAVSRGMSFVQINVYNVPTWSRTWTI
ncbi:MAG: hypothetical protein FWF59_04705 [Turicibacter sp.]|nr:hypothetical protein [Turicibacter sp.]